MDPFEKLSGSTFAWWLVAAEAAQVAWVKGSVKITSGLAANTGNTTRANTTAMVSAGTVRVPNRNRERKDIFSPQTNDFSINFYADGRMVRKGPLHG